MLFLRRWLPVSRMNVWSLVVLFKHSVCFPSVIRPECLTSDVVVRWTDELLCGGHMWVSQFETQHLRHGALALGGQVSAEWNRCPGSMAWHATDNVAPLRPSLAGWMPVMMGRFSAGMGCRHPVTICKASLMAESMRRVWALQHQTGMQFSAVEWTKAKVAVCNVVAPTPSQASELPQEYEAWCQLFAKWLKVSVLRERPVQHYSEIFGLKAQGWGCCCGWFLAYV